MAYYTVPQIIDIAKVSAFLVANDIDKGKLFGERLDPQWALRLYLERTAVEWMYAMDPECPTLQATANYLYALCGGYGRRAAAIIAAGGTGTVLSPVSPEDAAPASFEYLIPIRGTSFDSENLVDGRAVNYDNPEIVGEQLEIFWNEVNRYLAPSEFAHTATGVQFLIEGFDALTTHADSTFKIYIVHPDIVGTTTGGGGTSDYVPTLLSSAATSLTLTDAYETYVYTGAEAATWTLPAIAGVSGTRYFVKNWGTELLTLQRSGADQLYYTSLVNSITILPGGSFMVQSDGTHWVVFD